MTPTTIPVTYGQDASMRLYSVAEYQQLIATGALTADDRVELLENHVVLKMPRNPPHDGTLDLIMAALSGQIPRGSLLRVQQAIELSDSQPEPDFAIVSGNARSFVGRHPGPADVALLIEVADSSLLRDRLDKTRIYARASIPCYWIVNLVDRRVEVYDTPSGPVAMPSYGVVQHYHAGDVVPLTIGGAAITLAVLDLLP
jgi:Putative restriction endonuclease